MKLLLTTILMLLCLVAYGATPSYSNFSSNQFLPSGTYTVTVKNKPLLTNMFEYGALTFTNAQFATASTISNSATNMTFDAPFGQRRQFIFNTSGAPVMVISNGNIGILRANPTFPIDVNGQIFVSGNVNVGANFTFPDTSPTTYRLTWSTLTNWPSIYASSGTNMIWFNSASFGAPNGCGLALTKNYGDPTPLDSATNTMIWSQGTNLVISDGIQANSTFGQFNQFTFSTSGTPVMVISNGMVGIGKANPTQPLDVVGTVSATTVRTGNGGLSSTAVGSFAAAYGFDFDGLGEGLRFVTWNNGAYWAAGQMYSNGVVTLSSSTNASLFVNDNATNTAIYSTGTNLVISDGITANGTMTVTSSAPFIPLNINTNGGTAMYMDGRGYVGIGKANPSYTLDLNGSQNIPSSSSLVFGGNNNVGVIGDGSSLKMSCSGTLRFNAFNGVAWPDIMNVAGTHIGLGTNVYVTNSIVFKNNTIYNSNTFPITANFANLTPCGCITWMSNFTLYLICTNSADGNATTNKLGGL